MVAEALISWKNYRRTKVRVVNFCRQCGLETSRREAFFRVPGLRAHGVDAQGEDYMVSFYRGRMRLFLSRETCDGRKPRVFRGPTLVTE